MNGGFAFSKPRDKITTALLGSILLIGKTSQSLAYGIGAKEISQNVVSMGQKVEYSQKGSVESKIEEIKNNVSESKKQAINVLAEAAEKCIGTVLDTVTPSVSAIETKIAPSINSWPTASNVAVGQTVGDSKLSAGSANVPGSFSWVPTIANKKLETTGEVSYVCQFVPRDTEKYAKVMKAIYFKVLPGKPSINSWPTASNVTVGQTVGDSKLSAGSANVPGSFSWLPTIANKKLETIGEVSYVCQFVPRDTKNYAKVTKTIYFKVIQGNPKINSFPAASSITYGQKLSDSKLSGGSANVAGKFEWKDSSITPNAGERKYTVKFIPDKSDYKPIDISVKLTVNKASPQIYNWPTASSIIDGETIAKASLSGGHSNVKGNFSWVESKAKPNIGVHEYKVKFTPVDSSNYKDIVEKIQVKVKKVDVKIHWPSVPDLIYGQRLSDSKLSNGSANIKGNFVWVDPNIKPSAGSKTYNLIFKPYDSANYSESSHSIHVQVKKADPKIITQPCASDIYYGQKLSCSQLNGGKSETNGDFSWKYDDNTLVAGKHTERVVFTPYDYSNYNSIFIDVPVYVKKAPVVITSYPSVSSITYGQSLSSSIISNFNTNVCGTANWLNSSEVLNAGTHVRSIVFTPYDYNNYETVSTTAQIIVNKAMPKLNDKRLQITYKPGIILNDLPLPEGWIWKTPNVPLDDIGEFKFVATHPGDNNYNSNSETLIISIDKAEPKLSLSDITYDEKKTLKDIELPPGWHWIDENEVPSVSKSAYKASFSSQEAGTKFYNDRKEIDLKINVKKADPGIEKWAEPTANVNYGDNIEDIKLGNGKTKVSGKFKLLDCGNTKLKVGDHQFKIMFTPDSTNYETKTETINIRVLKNMNPAEPPQKISIDNVIRGEKSIKFEVVGGTYGIEFSSDNGKTWQDSAKFTNLSPKTEYSFVHRFKDNESRCASKISPVLKISTRGSAPIAPKELKVKKKTNHEIIFESNNQLEFSSDNGKTWQNSHEFKNLKGSTKYTFIARFKATDDHIAGLSSNPVTVKTRSWIGNIFNKIFGKK